MVSLAACLLAGCSGGSNGVLSTRSSATATYFVAVNIDASRLTTTQVSNGRRNPKFVGPTNIANTAIQYSFVGGANPSGSIQMSTCTAGANGGTGSIYTCSIGAAAATYTGLTLTLINGVTTLGSGSYAGAPFTINGGAATGPLSVTITPVLAGPSVSIVQGQATEFFTDNTSQSIEISTNEVDGIGNIITTYYGPVSNWQTLTVTQSNGTNGMSYYGLAPGLVETVSQVPNSQDGAAFTLAYAGIPTNASNLSVTVTDGVNTPATLSIPFVSMTASTNAINVTGGQQTFFVFETISAGTLPDTSLLSTSTDCGANVTFSPTLGSNALSGGGATTQHVTYTATHAGGASGTCHMLVESPTDSNLSETETITY
jgi:hypothetical protein